MTWFGRVVCGSAVLLLVGAAPALSAQDSTAGRRIQVGVNYTPGVNPGIVVMAGPGLDSVRAIVERDLMQSDRFTVALLADTLGRLNGSLDPTGFTGTGLSWAIELQPLFPGVEVWVHDLTAGQVRQHVTRTLDIRGVGDGRMGIHRLSDEIVGWTVGGQGIAATRILYRLKSGNGATDGAIWRMDADGANPVRVTRPGPIQVSPAWSPDGSRIAYAEYSDGAWSAILLSLATGTRQVVPNSRSGALPGLAFSPDGVHLAFARSTGRKTDIFTVDIGRMCCAAQLTSSRTVLDDYSPAYSPDGRRITFVSERPGSPQIYVMDADGTNQDGLVPFDIAAKSQSYFPRWSPDGGKIVFSRDLNGGRRQLFTFTLSSGRVIQQTSQGERNDSPSWAPDSRHIVFVSTLYGRDQLFVLDLESGSRRQLPTPGVATYPAWSRVLNP